MRRLYIIALLMIGAYIARSQSINRAEYFFDNDPGVGNGIALTISFPGDSIDET